MIKRDEPNKPELCFSCVCASRRCVALADRLSRLTDELRLALRGQYVGGSLLRTGFGRYCLPALISSEEHRSIPAWTDVPALATFTVR